MHFLLHMAISISDPLVISLIVAGAILLLIVLVFAFISIRRNKGRRKKEHDVVATVVDSNDFIKALGGPDNIVSHSSAGSRLSITLKDSNIVDKTALDSLKTGNYVLYSNKITIVEKAGAEALEKKIFSD